MTDRAKRAAEELTRRGWQMDTAEDGPALSRACGQCGRPISAEARYCQHCGARAELAYTRDTLADLEAAILAAVEQEKTR